eukprot:1138069-Pelagomonas_calceolata.AAC.1
MGLHKVYLGAVGLNILGLGYAHRCIFPRRFPGKDRLTPCRPDASCSNEKSARTNSRYLLRSTGWRGENREHSAPAAATPPTFKVRHLSQLLLEQRHVHLVEVKNCEGTRSKNQLEASK